VTNDPLLLQNQLCFPLYACAREVVRLYRPHLDKIGLTYTQYIVMMVLWERRSATVKELGAALRLDSGTLTPLLKKLEAEGLVTRGRDERDERSVRIALTGAGADLRARAEGIPAEMRKCIPLSDADARELYRLLYLILDKGRGKAHEL